ncbi:MAG: HPr family phosphocarrier protein [Gemmatimonas sp.]
MSGEAMRAPGAVAQTVTVINQRGLHARAAARFVKLAGGYDAAVTVTAKGTTVPGLSIMGLMMLAAGPGTQLEIAATGADAGAAVAALAKLVADRFDESE